MCIFMTLNTHMKNIITLNICSKILPTEHVLLSKSRTPNDLVNSQCSTLQDIIIIRSTDNPAGSGFSTQKYSIIRIMIVLLKQKACGLSEPEPASFGLMYVCS